MTATKPEPKPIKRIAKPVVVVPCRCGNEFGWRTDHASFCPLHKD